MSSKDESQEFRPPELKVRTARVAEKHVHTSQSLDNARADSTRLTGEKFFWSFVLTPCIFAVVAAIVVDVREEGRHFPDVDAEIERVTAKIEHDPIDWRNTTSVHDYISWTRVTSGLWQISTWPPSIAGMTSRQSQRLTSVDA